MGVVVTLTVCAGSVALAIVAFPLADYRPADAATLRDETVAVVSRVGDRSVDLAPHISCAQGPLKANLQDAAIGQRVSETERSRLSTVTLGIGAHLDHQSLNAG